MTGWFTDLYRLHCRADEWQQCEGCGEVVRIAKLKVTGDDVSLCPKCMKQCRKDTEQHYLEHPEDDPIWDELKDCAEAHSLRHLDNVHALLGLVQREIRARETW